MANKSITIKGRVVLDSRRLKADLKKVKDLVKSTVNELNKSASVQPTIKAKLKVDQNDVKRQAQTAGKTFEKQFKQNFKVASKGLVKDLKGAAVLASRAFGAIGAGIGKGLKVSKEVDAAMATISSLSDETERLDGSLKQVEKTITGVAAGLPVSFQETANAAVALKRAGFELAEISEGALADVGNLAVGTGTAVDKSADIISGAKAIFGAKTPDDLTKSANILAHTANSANQSLENVGETLKSLKGFTIDAESFSVSSQLLANVNSRGSAQGTAIRRFYGRVFDLGEELSKDYGINVYNEDGSRKAFEEIQQQFIEFSLTATDLQKDEMVSRLGQQAGTLFKAMGETGREELAQMYIDAAEAGATAADGSTLLERMVKVQENSFSGALKTLDSNKETFFKSVGDGFKSTMHAAAVAAKTGLVSIMGGSGDEIGQPLADSIKNAMSGVTGLFGQFETDEEFGIEVFKLNPEVEARLIQLGVFLRQVIDFIGTTIERIKTSVQQTLPFWQLVSNVVTGIGTVVGGIATKITQLVSGNLPGILTVLAGIGAKIAATALVAAAPVLAIKAGIVAAVVAGGMLVQKLLQNKAVMDALNAAVTGVKNLVARAVVIANELWLKFKQVWQSTQPLRQELNRIVTQLMVRFIQYLRFVGKFWSQILGHLVKTVVQSKTFQRILLRVRIVAAVILTIVKGVLAFILKVVNGVVALNQRFRLTDKLIAAVKVGITFVMKLLDVITGIVDFILALIISTVQIVVEWAKETGVVQKIVEFVRDVFSEIVGFISEAISKTRSFFSENEKVSNVVTTIRDAFTGIGDSIQGLVDRTIEWATKFEPIKRALEMMGNLPGMGGGSGGGNAGDYAGLREAQEAIAKGTGTKADNKLIKDALITAAKEQGITDPEHLAYLVATAVHETGNFQFLEEQGDKSYFDKYDAGTALGEDLGNTKRGDGYKYRGRGFVQLTGRANYEKYSDILGEDLINNPDLASDPNIAAKILAHGMQNGTWTSRKLSDYGSGSNFDAVGARAIVNGSDRAQHIANIAAESGAEAVRNFKEITKLTGGSGGGASGGTTSSGRTVAVDTGNVTGSAATNGGSSEHHIDVKFNRAFLSLEDRVKAFDAIAKQYEAMGKQIEFSNNAVAGRVWDTSASMEDKMALYTDAVNAHTHSVTAGWDSLDYYAPDIGKDRYDASASNVKIIAPGFEGGQIENLVQQVGYGAYSAIDDAQGNYVAKIGHGDYTQAASGTIQVGGAATVNSGGDTSVSSSGNTNLDVDNVTVDADEATVEPDKTPEEQLRDYTGTLATTLDNQLEEQTKALKSEQTDLTQANQLLDARGQDNLSDEEKATYIENERRLKDVEAELNKAQQVRDLKEKINTLEEKDRLGLATDADGEALARHKESLSKLGVEYERILAINTAEYNRKAQEQLDAQQQAAFEKWQQEREQADETLTMDIEAEFNDKLGKVDEEIFAEQDKGEDANDQRLALLELQKQQLEAQRDLNLELVSEKTKLAELQKLKELGIKQAAGYDIDKAIANQERLITEKEINSQLERRNNLRATEQQLANDLLARSRQNVETVDVGTAITLPETESQKLQQQIDQTTEEYDEAQTTFGRDLDDINALLEASQALTDEKRAELEAQKQLIVERMIELEQLGRKKIEYASALQSIQEESRLLARNKELLASQNALKTAQASLLEASGFSYQAEQMRQQIALDELKIAQDERKLELERQLAEARANQGYTEEQRAVEVAHIQSMQQAEGELYQTRKQHIELQMSDRAKQAQAIMKTAMGDLSNGIHDVLMGTKSLGQVFGDMLKNIASQLIKMATQKLVQKAFAGIMGGAGGGGEAAGGFLGAIGKALGFNDGGYVPYVPGTTRANKDTVPAMLTQGEAVLTRDEVRALGGRRGFESFRKQIRAYNDGGYVQGRISSPVTSSNMSRRQQVNYTLESKNIGGVEVVGMDQIKNLERRLNGRIASSNNELREGIVDSFASSNSFRDSVGMRDV